MEYKSSKFFNFSNELFHHMWYVMPVHTAAVFISQIPNPFHCSDVITLPTGESFSHPLPDKAAHEYNFTNSAFLSYECAAASEAIRAGRCNLIIGYN